MTGVQRCQPNKEHTPTPWTYRPNTIDDWGWIRDADGNLAATARDGRVWSDQFDEYRAAKTDPYEPNARFIVKAVNSYEALKARVTELEGALREITKIKARPVAEGFVTGPLAHFEQAQRIARVALKSEVKND